MSESPSTQVAADVDLLAACCTSLDTDLCTLDREYDSALVTRKNIIDKLHSAVMVADISLDNKDPELLAAQMTAIKVLDDLLGGQEKNTLNRAKIKLSKVTTDNESAMGVNVKAIMSILNGTDGDVVVEDADFVSQQRAVEEAFHRSGSVIIDEELVTSNDVSELSDTMNVNILNIRPSDE